SNPEHVYMGTAHGFGGVIQSILNFFDDELWHAAVDVTGEFNEARFDARFLALPGQIERIDRNTVATQTRSRIKRHEAKRLGSSRVNDLPDIDVHSRAH